MVQKKFGSAGDRVIVEDFLQGEELSVMSITDGETIIPLAPAQDHKAAYDGGRGPNTGGMGAYSPVPLCDDKLASQIEEEILKPTVSAMSCEGEPFHGVLYAGLMITEDGPKVLEFNCRFGDPEAQAVLPRLQGDLAQLLYAASVADGSLSDVATEINFTDEAAVCVVAASEGYPLDYEKGKIIEGLDKVSGDVRVYHAGTAITDSGWVTDGGRVLGVAALGDCTTDAREKAYEAMESISFSGMHYRDDIARR